MVSESRSDVVPGSDLTQSDSTNQAPEPLRVTSGTEISQPIWRGVLPATAREMIDALEELEATLAGQETAELPTEHVLHAGMYVRTVAMQPGQVIFGCTVKRPTLVIVAGTAEMLVGEQLVTLEGYNVIPASAGRKQVFHAISTVLISMAFPTSAKTVEEAEREFTDDADRLLSRRQNANRVVITED